MLVHQGVHQIRCLQFMHLLLWITCLGSPLDPSTYPDHQTVASWTLHGTPPSVGVIEEAHLVSRHARDRKEILRRRGRRIRGVVQHRAGRASCSSGFPSPREACQ